MTKSLDWLIMARPNLTADSKMTTGKVMIWPGLLIMEAMMLIRSTLSSYFFLSPLSAHDPGMTQMVGLKLSCTGLLSKVGQTYLQPAPS